MVDRRQGRVIRGLAEFLAIEPGALSLITPTPPRRSGSVRIIVGDEGERGAMTIGSNQTQPFAGYDDRDESNHHGTDRATVLSAPFSVPTR